MEVNENVKKNLDSTIDNALYSLLDLEMGSEEYKNGAESVAALYKAKIDEEKAFNENENYKKQNKLSIINIALGAVGTAVGFIFYNTINKRGYRFEESGTITSKTFNRVLSDIKLPKLFK